MSMRYILALAITIFSYSTLFNTPSTFGCIDIKNTRISGEICNTHRCVIYACIYHICVPYIPYTTYLTDRSDVSLHLYHN